jgi:hypothetical protein
MTTYRYLFCDLLSNEILAELPITGVTFTQQLNSAGTLSGSLLLSGLSSAANATNATIPGRCGLYVDRNGELIWGGIIWSREYNSADQHITIQAREFESYFERRRITTTQGFTNQDQLFVARQLVNTAQAEANGDIGIQVGTETSGVLIDRVFYSYELKTLYSALLDLSRAQDGFDFHVDVAYDGSGTPTKTLQLDYPLSGTRYSSSNPDAPFFEFPAGNIVEYSYPEDGSTAANVIYVAGAGSNEGKEILTASDLTKLSDGWPLLEDSANYSDITDLTLLGELASGQVAAVSYPPTTLKIVAPPYVDPVLGSYIIGDDARVRIIDDRFPNGLDAIYRIVALSVTVGENGPEQVTLTLTLPTS